MCDELIEGLDVTREKGSLLLTWAPRMRCLNSDEASLTWMIIRRARWVDKKLFAARLAISPQCIRCGDLEESIEHAFLPVRAAAV